MIIYQEIESQKLFKIFMKDGARRVIEIDEDEASLLEFEGTKKFFGGKLK